VITVASRELKNRLGRYLRLVREGEEVRVTDRGEPVAFIVPFLSEGGSGIDDLRRVVAKGSVTLASGRLQRSRPVVLTHGPSIAQMIAGDRR
jgi:prevent-host-death family protein